MLWYLSIALISKNSLLKLALPEGSIAMSFRRDETGLSATNEGAIERQKYRAIERRDLQSYLTESSATADRLQRPLRSCFRQQVSASVRPLKT